MEAISIDLVTVIIAAVLYMILGAFWYSPLLFGKPWEKHSAFPAKVHAKWLRFSIAFMNAVVMAFFLAIVEAFMGSASTMDGIYVAIGVWLGFVATTQLPSFLWSKKPLLLYFIDVGFYFCGFVVMGGVIGA
jgi:hypothetical protein